MLSNAKQILISELVLARGIEEKDAEELINEAVQ